MITIKCKQSFARPGRKFATGETVTLPDEEANQYVKWGHAEATTPAAVEGPKAADEAEAPTA